MDPMAVPQLTSWQNFYVILGSSAGGLTGLQFVVMTLIVQARVGGNRRDIHAFGTPTVMHFCTALLISALMSAPWPDGTSLGGCLAAGGVAGIIYSFRVVWHARNANYSPDLEDRIWYFALPFLAHLALVAAAVLMLAGVAWSAAIVAGDALIFLLLGVHNAWDTVTFIAVQHGKRLTTRDNPVEPEAL